MLKPHIWFKKRERERGDRYRDRSIERDTDEEMIEIKVKIMTQEKSFKCMFGF